MSIVKAQSCYHVTTLNRLVPGSFIPNMPERWKYSREPYLLIARLSRGRGKLHHVAKLLSM